MYIYMHIYIYIYIYVCNLHNFGYLCMYISYSINLIIRLKDELEFEMSFCILLFIDCWMAFIKDKSITND